MFFRRLCISEATRYRTKGYGTRRATALDEAWSFLVQAVSEGEGVADGRTTTSSSRCLAEEDGLGRGVGGGWRNVVVGEPSDEVV